MENDGAGAASAAPVLFVAASILTISLSAGLVGQGEFLFRAPKSRRMKNKENRKQLERAFPLWREHACQLALPYKKIFDPQGS